jgi:uncharacterized protein Yka (UPF0111/DUF47 family)
MRLRKIIPTGIWTNDEAEYQRLFGEAATNVADCAHHLHHLISALPPAVTHVEAARACEHHGDDLAHAIGRCMNTSFIGPFDREDIHALVERLADVVDDMCHVANMIDLLQLDELPREAGEIAVAVTEAADALPRLVGSLRDNTDPAAPLRDIDTLESRANEHYRRGPSELFSGRHDDLTVLKWKDILDGLEHAMNGIEKIGGIVEAITIRRS